MTKKKEFYELGGGPPVPVAVTLAKLRKYAQEHPEEFADIDLEKHLAACEAELKKQEQP